MTKTLPEHTVYIPLCNICGWKDSRPYESTQERRCTELFRNATFTAGRDHVFA